MKKLGGQNIFMKNRGGHKNNQVMTHDRGVTKLVNFPVIAVAVILYFKVAIDPAAR